jgi:hypothetical protein
LFPALEFLVNIDFVLKFNYFSKSDAWLPDSSIAFCSLDIKGMKKK